MMRGGTEKRGPWTTGVRIASFRTEQGGERNSLGEEGEEKRGVASTVLVLGPILGREKGEREKQEKKGREEWCGVTTCS